MHKLSTTFCFYTPKATPARQNRTQTCPTTKEAYRAVLSPLRRKCRVAYEVSTGAQWVADVVRPLAKEVVLADARQMPWLYRDHLKTDTREARKLAFLLYLNQLPQVYLPPPEVSSRRALVTYRRSVVNRRMEVKNSIRSILRSGHWRSPHRSVWSKPARHWLRELPLDVPTRVRLDGLLQNLNLQEAHLATVERELDLLASAHPGVALLQTIPGIGPRTAEAIVVFGWEIARFPSCRHFAYAMLRDRQPWDERRYPQPARV